jgi:hypothetical protein
MGSELLRRVRWGNVVRAAVAVGLVGAVIAWPRLAPPEPRLPASGAVDPRADGGRREPKTMRLPAAKRTDRESGRRDGAHEARSVEGRRGRRDMRRGADRAAGEGRGGDHANGGGGGGGDNRRGDGDPGGGTGDGSPGGGNGDGGRVGDDGGPVGGGDGGPVGGGDGGPVVGGDRADERGERGGDGGPVDGGDRVGGGDGRGLGGGAPAAPPDADPAEAEFGFESG